MTPKREARSARRARLKRELPIAMATGDVDTVVSSLKELRFLPNIYWLGPAFRYGGAKVVDAYLECGFGFPEADYLLPVIDRMERVVESTGLLTYLFPLDPKPEDDTYEILSDEEREKVAQLFLDRSELDGSEILYHAALFGDEAMVDYLMRVGVRPDPAMIDTSTKTPCLSSDYLPYIHNQRLTVEDMVTIGSPDLIAAMFKAFHNMLGQKLPTRKNMFRSRRVREVLFSPQVFPAVFAHTTVGSVMTRRTLFTFLTLVHNETGVRLLLDSGYLKRRDILKSCVKLVQKRYPQELGILSLLLDALRQIDAKRSRPDAFSLDADPYSAAVLKSSWNYKPLEDNTIIITGYKGEQTEIEVPERIGRRRVTAIGDRAFSPTAKPLTQEKKDARNALVSVEIPDGIENLGTHLFDCCSALTRVKLPAGLTKIPDSTFENTPALQSFEFPPAVTCIGFAAFWHSGIQELYVPDTVNQIEVAAFQGSALKSLSIPAKALVEADFKMWRRFGACNACVNLTKMELRGPGGIIPDYAFRGCLSLKTLKLPQGTRRIGREAFANGALESITIPASVKEVRDYAFAVSGSLKQAIFEGASIKLGFGIFYACAMLQDVRLPPRLKQIPTRTFEGCVLLHAPSFPSTLKEIGAHAFARTEVKKADIPAGIKIAQTAFRPGQTLIL